MLCALIFYASGGTYRVTSTPNDEFFVKLFHGRFIYSGLFILGYNEGILCANANMKVDNTPDLELHNSLTGKSRFSISNVGV